MKFYKFPTAQAVEPLGQNMAVSSQYLKYSILTLSVLEILVFYFKI